jgi:hypothetical protein
MQNSVYLLSKVYPTQTINGGIYNTVPTHWNFAEEHENLLSGQVIGTFYENLTAFFASQPTFKQYLSRVQNALYDMHLFMEQIPRFAPIIKDGIAYYSLYSSETVLLLGAYCWYSVIHEYVVVSKDSEFKRMREEELKSFRRTKEREVLADIFAGDDEFEREDEDWNIRQIQITETDDLELRKQASDFLVAIINMELKTKQSFNKSYSEITDATMKLKFKDKKRITDYLGGLTRDERKVEQTLRSHKLGRWNVGLQKGLYQYDKNTYQNEITENIFGPEEVNVLSGLDIEDLERIQEQENQVYEEEGNDISRLDEEYDNGHYYEEDYADDRETDF